MPRSLGLKSARRTTGHTPPHYSPAVVASISPRSLRSNHKNKEAFHVDEEDMVYSSSSRSRSSNCSSKLGNEGPSSPSQKTSDHEDRSCNAPVEGKFELELMSSFSQQMILGSTMMNNVTNGKPHGARKRAARDSSLPMPNREGQGGPVSKRCRRTAPPKHTFGACTLNTPHILAQSESIASQHGWKEGQPQLKLALKLPDGKRIEHCFAPTDTITNVMKLAQREMNVFASECDVYSMLEVPKVLLGDWGRTLERYNICDRTVLYIEEKD